PGFALGHPGGRPGPGTRASTRAVGRRRPAVVRGHGSPPGDRRRVRSERPRPDVRPGRRAVPGGHLPAGGRTRRTRSRAGRTMTRENTAPPPTPASPAPAATATRPPSDGAIPSRRERSVPRAGWMVVSGKEFADHLWSAPFVALIIVLGIAALIPMYFAADMIRSPASQVTGASSIFLFLFSLA